MAYIANHYVNLDGVMYIPGEIIDEVIDAEKEEWLLGKGAIRKKVAPDSFFDEEDKQANTAVTDQGDGEGNTDVDAEDTEDTEGTEDDADADTEDTEEEEYEDAEPPEIDVADSIVAPAEEQAAEEKKPARKRRGGKEKA